MKYRVWHVSQIPAYPFYVPVASVEQGVKIMDILSDYDLFQLKNNIKPDDSTLQGLQVKSRTMYDWVDWVDVKTGEDDPRKYLESIKQLAKS